jgi:transcriptional regulator GlxA family with amidase domain
MSRRVGIILFEGFELLDVFGPAEAFGALRNEFELVLVAAEAGPVKSSQGPRAIADAGFADCPRLDILLVPGGIGTRSEVENASLLASIRRLADRAELVLSVCTGAALLARAGLLDGRRATTNKRSFGWVKQQGPQTRWVEQARFVEDGNLWTSSGVTAGIDMALAVIARLSGTEVAETIALRIEHVWQSDPGFDPFAAHYGLGKPP